MKSADYPKKENRQFTFMQCSDFPVTRIGIAATFILGFNLTNASVGTFNVFRMTLIHHFHIIHFVCPQNVAQRSPNMQSFNTEHVAAKLLSNQSERDGSRVRQCNRWLMWEEFAKPGEIRFAILGSFGCDETRTKHRKAK